jgi:hypothetical protein
MLIGEPDVFLRTAAVDGSADPRSFPFTELAKA